MIHYKTGDCTPITSEINLKTNNISYDYKSDPKLITNKFNEYFLSMGNHNDNRHSNPINLTSYKYTIHQSLYT